MKQISEKSPVTQLLLLFDRRLHFLSSKILLCQWFSERRSCFSRVFSRCVFYFFDDDQGTADLGSLKIEVLNVSDLSTEDFYCFFRRFGFFLYCAGFLGDKKSSDFYVWETVFGQGCKTGYCSGYTEVIFFSVGFVFCIFFGSSVDG